jgi:hypothetical protein
MPLAGCPEPLWTEVALKSLNQQLLGKYKLRFLLPFVQDEEMFALEDIIADSFEEQEEEDEEGSVACTKVASLVKLSGRMASDPAFARQLKRKYV